LWECAAAPPFLTPITSNPPAQSPPFRFKKVAMSSLRCRVMLPAPGGPAHTKVFFLSCRCRFLFSFFLFYSFPHVLILLFSLVRGHRHQKLPEYLVFLELGSAHMPFPANQTFPPRSYSPSNFAVVGAVPGFFFPFVIIPLNPFFPRRPLMIHCFGPSPCTDRLVLSIPFPGLALKCLSQPKLTFFGVSCCPGIREVHPWNLSSLPLPFLFQEVSFLPRH